jgi:hypothetical protein
MHPFRPLGRFFLADPPPPDNTGQTVVHFVASKNNIDVARRLFENQPPASARVRDKRGQVSLSPHLAFSFAGALGSQQISASRAQYLYKKGLTQTPSTPSTAPLQSAQSP